MKKALTIILCFFSVVYSGAQDIKSGRLDIMAEYSVGTCFFKLNLLEAINHYQLTDAVKNGYYNENKFGPTVINQVKLMGSAFKNKSWYLELHGGWGRNEISSYGYTSDQAGNPMKFTNKTTFSIWYFGWGISKTFKIGRGYIKPGLNFSIISNNYESQPVYEARSRETAEFLYSGRKNSIYNTYTPGRSGALMFFDSPEIELNYQLRLIHHLYFTTSYSYWLANSMPNDYYGLADRYVIKFKNSQHFNRTFNKYWGDDLYSHNLNIGLTLKLLK